MPLSQYINFSDIFKDGILPKFPIFMRSESYDQRIIQTEKELSILKLQKAEADKQFPITSPVQSRSMVEHSYTDHAGKPYHFKQRITNSEELVETIYGDEESKSWRPNSTTQWTVATTENIIQFENLWNVSMTEEISEEC